MKTLVNTTLAAILAITSLTAVAGPNSAGKFCIALSDVASTIAMDRANGVSPKEAFNDGYSMSQGRMGKTRVRNLVNLFYFKMGAMPATVQAAAAVQAGVFDECMSANHHPDWKPLK